ncbi:MAG: bifunctional DNA primase/polymerase, partial [Rubripirellula sp.]
MSELLEAAIRYADLGYAVFPCATGLNPTPQTKRGFKDASTNHDRINDWWARHPDANVGLATQGLLVVDVDGPDNPWLTNERANELGNLPTASTPRGGCHLVFRRPRDVRWRCSVGRLAPQVDVRTDGGYIVVAPSKRPDGKYQWLEGRELNVPADQLCEPPRWLADALDALVKPEVVANSDLLPRPTHEQVSCVIPNGQRNATLASIAGRMRQAGLNESEILAGLKQVNRERCNPPLEPKEVAKVASSISRYQPRTTHTYIPAPSLQSVNGSPIDGSAIELESNVIWFSDIEPVEIAWLWPARIPAGRITLLV